MKQKIIFLNGASSSGKTSIAKELLKLSNYTYLSADEFVNKQPPLILDGLDIALENFLKIMSEFHKVIKETADKGESLVIDHFLEQPKYYKECKDALNGKSTVWVSVIAQLKELEKREAGRKDRVRGLARIQYKTVYKEYVYDLQIDTSETTPNEAAYKIEDYSRNISN